MISQNTIKALWICSWYPSRKIHYLGVFIQRQAKAVSKLSDITVLYVIGDSVSDYEIEIEKGDFLTIRVYFPETSNIFVKTIRQFISQVKGYKTVLKLVGKPNIIHVQSLYPAAIFALFLKLLKKIPFVVSEHQGGYLQYDEFKKNKVRLYFSRLVFKQASIVIGMSQQYIQALRNLGLNSGQFRVISNVVDTELFKPNLQKKENQSPIYQFINLSLFNDKIKNITGIIRSTAKLAEKRDDFVVNLVGKGDDEDKIIQLAASLGVLNRFVFLKGYLLENEAAYLLQHSDCLIMFSNFESQSVVTLEAASSGLPIIATKTCGISERVTPETGILLNIGDETGLVEAMNYMIDNHHKYDPSVIRSKIVEKCSREVVGKAICSVYESVLGGKNKH